RQGVTRLLLTAAGLWTQACVDCRVEQLAVVAVGETTFVRRGFSTWYGKEMASNSPSGSQESVESLETSLKTALEPIQWLLAGDSRPPAPRSKTLVDYVPLQLSAAT